MAIVSDFFFFLFLSHPTLPRKIAWHFPDILFLFTLPLQRVTVEYLHYDKRTEITNGHENIVHRTNNNKLLQLWTYGKNTNILNSLDTDWKMTTKSTVGTRNL
jgi:hypothetical protein